MMASANATGVYRSELMDPSFSIPVGAVSRRDILRKEFIRLVEKFDSRVVNVEV